MTKSDNEQYYRVTSGYRHNHPPQASWATTIFQQWGTRKWNGHHQRLQTQDSPSISACTTATNLSSLGDFQSNSTIYTSRRMNLDENLRRTIPEIEPLQNSKDKKEDIDDVPELPQKKDQKVHLRDIKMQSSDFKLRCTEDGIVTELRTSSAYFPYDSVEPPPPADFKLLVDGEILRARPPSAIARMGRKLVQH